MKCPRCKSKNVRILNEYVDADLPSFHVECTDCEYNFNEWNGVSQDTLKKIFGEGWQIYV